MLSLPSRAPGCGLRDHWDLSRVPSCWCGGGGEGALASPLGFLLSQPSPSPPSALAAGQLSWVRPVSILTPPSHLEIHIWTMCLALHRSPQMNTWAQGSWDHIHTGVGTNPGKHSCAHLHGHIMPVGSWAPPAHTGLLEVHLQIFLHIQDLSIPRMCVAKCRHRDGYHWAQIRATLAGPCCSFSSSMPTCKGPRVILWAFLPSSTLLPSQSQARQRTRTEVLGTVYFIS